MKLYLVSLKHKEKFEYKHVLGEANEEDFDPSCICMNRKYFLNRFPVYSLSIDASIYSPPTVRVTCSAENFTPAMFVPYYSVYGIMAEDTDRNDFDIKEYVYYCLLSNSTHSYLPLVVINVEIDRNKSEIIVTLIEKRASILASTHSFASVPSQNCDYYLDDSKGLLSIGEIVENLSTVPEDEYIENPEDIENKNIFCFSGYSYCSSSANGDKNQLMSCLDFDKTSCAFISRFVAPASQSRLSIISSLMYKYGYGFAYRIADRQYYAIDLLSNSAPGFHNSIPFLCAYGVYSDSYIFNDSNESAEYFSTYGKNYYVNHEIPFVTIWEKYMKEQGEVRGKINLMNRNTDANESLEGLLNKPKLHYFSHDFADFYCNRILFRSQFSSFSPPSYYISELGRINYCQISRFSPLSSAANYISGGRKNKKNKNKSGFDFTISVNISDSNLFRTTNQVVASRDCDVKSVIVQGGRHSSQEGAENLLFEDQVELNLQEEAGGCKNKVVTFGKSIQTVNQRIAYAKYKHDFMHKNYFTHKFVFEDNIGLSLSFNIVYELFQWLGFHTDMFGNVAKLYSMSVEERQKNSSSGATHFIKDKFSPPVNSNYEYLLNFIKNNENYGQGFLNYNTQYALFGKFHISIEAEYLDDYSDGRSSSYSTSFALTFYCDCIDNNIGTLCNPAEANTRMNLKPIPKPIFKKEVSSDIDLIDIEDSAFEKELIDESKDKNDNCKGDESDKNNSPLGPLAHSPIRRKSEKSIYFAHDKISENDDPGIIDIAAELGQAEEEHSFGNIADNLQKSFICYNSLANDGNRVEKLSINHNSDDTEPLKLSKDFPHRKPDEIQIIIDKQNARNVHKHKNRLLLRGDEIIVQEEDVKIPNFEDVKVPELPDDMSDILPLYTRFRRINKIINVREVKNIERLDLQNKRAINFDDKSVAEEEFSDGFAVQERVKRVNAKNNYKNQISKNKSAVFENLFETDK